MRKALKITTEKEFLEEVSHRIDHLERHQPFYQIIKTGLLKLKNWRNKPRGDARKGYLLGMGKNKR